MFFHTPYPEKINLPLPFEEFDGDEVEVKYIYTPGLPEYPAEVEILSIKHRGAQVVATVSSDVIKYLQTHLLELHES